METQPETEEFVLPYSLGDHRSRFLDESIVYLKIVNSGRLAGFFILALDEDERSIEFRRVVVVPKERGIGQSAIKLMERFCKRELNRTRVWLDVYKANARGRHIYEKLGYQLFDHNSNDSELLLYYEKEL